MDQPPGHRAENPLAVDRFHHRRFGHERFSRRVTFYPESPHRHGRRVLEHDAATQVRGIPAERTRGQRRPQAERVSRSVSPPRKGSDSVHRVDSRAGRHRRTSSAIAEHLRNESETAIDWTHLPGGNLCAQVATTARPPATDGPMTDGSLKKAALMEEMAEVAGPRRGSKIPHAVGSACCGRSADATAQPTGSMPAFRGDGFGSP